MVTPNHLCWIETAAVDASIGAATVNQRPRPPTARMDLATNGISSACEEDCIAFDEYKWMHDTDGHEFEKLIEDEYEYSEQVRFIAVNFKNYY